MHFSHPTVLIMSTSPAFAREIAEHWPPGSNPPEFTVLDQGLFCESAVGNYDLAIADATSSECRRELRQALNRAAKPAILVFSGRSVPFVSHPEPTRQSAIIEFSKELGGGGITGENLWPVMAGLLGREILRRCHAEDRARDAEAGCEVARAQATLGRYISEMRHNINNALTSVLGNAELLTLEPGLAPHVLSQAETIQNMALRLHEVFRRFASIEEELCVVARQSGKEVVQAHLAATRK